MSVVISRARAYVTTCSVKNMKCPILFLKYHALDEVEEHGNSQVTSFTVAGKTVSKLQASKEKLHAVSLRDEQKKSAVKTKKTFKPKQTSTPVETFKQPTKLKQQDEVPICSIILAPVCDRPSDALQCEQVRHWTSLENAPIGACASYAIMA
ncbi:hypothetical protein chiPu_0002381 [Chiloscyllium punctatum]|uniref:Uncharacterized protein n=1 Tax=Chiloscyllium punctatum TaxID=137246 RepID=A0A401S0Q8_CHIPU|nr:hypothetical protein [Chiloscyllium punctatum]